MKVTEGFLDTAKLLSRFLVPRYITGRLLRFAEAEGITRIFSGMGTFSLDEITYALKDKKGYELDDPLRRKMIIALVSLFSECGCLDKKEDSYSWVGIVEKDIILDREEEHILKRNFSSQVSFIEKCMEHVPKFLTGGAHLYSFDGDSMDIWDSFLGNLEFSFARYLLLLNLRIKNTPEFKFLDLGYGPGYGLISARELYPEIDITAIDFAGSFTFLVKEKIWNNKLKSIDLMSNGKWKGFGHALPFSDSSFDAIFFSCADPYISPDIREFVYRDIYRIIRAGGALGILTRAYPDSGCKHVKNHWTRMATYCHDFAESVCEGWHGFYDAEESFGLFKKIGFSKNKKSVAEVCMLDSALWMLDKD